MEQKLTPTERVIMIALLTILTITMLSGLISCTTESNVEKKRKTYQIDNEQFSIQIIVVDSCEYLYGPWGNATVLTHKGNCRNLIHNR